ncbi:hypothetical protein UFOVP259_20 [uncultured Caudovirales phage]|uniref:Uncharacterized protein n=1 Tax=uncultured Caudovirales phage TaxID=2100421 RepID=A0A6J5LGX2_9CAUD|nr:hypothetical protein UFOVP259_20 [uncultured Caudovirales phage]
MKNFDLFQASTEDIAFEHKDKFSTEFLEWLPENHHIWIAFEAEALKVLRKGFKHYSARVIVEVLRHHSALAEKPDNGWKINNNIIPYLGRLFAIINPTHANFFEYRQAIKPARDKFFR